MALAQCVVRRLFFGGIFYPVCILKIIIMLSLLNVVSCTPPTENIFHSIYHSVLILVVFPLSLRLWLYINFFIPFPLNLELAILAQFSQMYFLNFYPFNNFSRNSHVNICVCVFGVQLAAGLDLQDECWPQQPSPLWALVFRESWSTQPRHRREARYPGARAAAERPARLGSQWVRVSAGDSGPFISCVFQALVAFTLAKHFQVREKQLKIQGNWNKGYKLN